MSFLYIPMSRGSNGSNTFVGVAALQNVTTGVDNSAFGFYALNALVSGNRNTAVGSEALLLNTSSNNTAVGSGALRGSTTGQNNVALGQDAMRAGNPNNSNVAVGYSAMYNCGLTENSVGIGQLALYNAAGTIGNTAVGNTAGLLITTGSKNTILGAFTGNQGGLDIRTLSNYIVISDGDGNPRIWVDNTGQVNFPGGSVLPGGTANGVLYLNGSKVVTSGSALTFDGIDLAIGNAGGLALFKRASDGLSVGRVGSRSSTDISVYNAGGVTAEFVAGANELRFNVAAAEQMRLNSTGLGIGTNNPQAKLHTVGASGAFLENTAGGFFQQIGFRSGVATFAYYDSLEFGYALAQGFSSYTATMRLTSSGNLGLGVTPSAWTTTDSVRALQLNGGSFYVFGANRCFVGQNVFVASGGIETYATTATASTYRQFQGAHSWFTAPSGTAGNAISFTQAMTLHASGGLSVGSTSDPGANTIALTKLSIKVDGPFFTGANIDSGSNQLGIGVSSGTAAVGLFTANIERIRIKSGGQLRYVPLAADPAGAENGDVYYNSSTNKLRLYAAGAWTDLN